MNTYRVTDKNNKDVVIAVFDARDQAAAEIIGKEHARGTAVFGLWVQQASGDWLEF